jgi:Family of unknown function (DUF5754)
MKFRIEKADAPHKWFGVFTDEKRRETRIPFGAAGYQDLTQHHDRRRKTLYLARHRKNENWNDPQTPGALSRWILWHTPNLEQNVKQFKSRFNLE